MLWATEHFDFWDHMPQNTRAAEPKCFNPTPIKAARPMHM